MAEASSLTVRRTFLVTDIEASTRLWERFPDAMLPALERHDALLRAAVGDSGGRVMVHTGDGLVAVFPNAGAAVEAAIAAQRSLTTADLGAIEEFRVRMGVHSGEVVDRDGEYFGWALNVAARLHVLAHGGQIVLSGASQAEAVRGLSEPVELVDLGLHRLRDIAEPIRVYSVGADGLSGPFDTLRDAARPVRTVPRALTSFVGRTEDLERTRGHLRDQPLVTPVGDYYLYVIDPAGGHTAGFHGAPAAVVVSVTEGGSVTANPALAATTGAIAGTVTSDGSGDPVADTVFLGIDLATGLPGAGAVSGPSGAYVADGLSPGSRLGGFIDLSGAHSVEFHSNSPAPAGATPIPVAAGATTAGVNAALAPQAAPSDVGHLRGNVSGTGGGGDLEGVAVIALHASTFAYAAGDLTDADGNYDIGVDLGGYKLLFYDPSGDHAAEWFNNVPMSDMASAGTVTTTAAEPTKRRDTSLAPTGGAAAGTVSDASTGDPVVGAWAVFLGPTGNLGATAVTGSDGTYRLTGIPAGATRVTFVDPSGRHRQEYWDDATSFVTANVLTMIAGDTVTGIDAALTATG